MHNNHNAYLVLVNIHCIIPIQYSSNSSSSSSSRFAAHIEQSGIILNTNILSMFCSRMFYNKIFYNYID